jgi:nucleoside-diphosphate-sugar epimerase
LLALVTGAQGALGRSLTLKLLAEGFQVHVLTRGAWRGLDSDTGVIEGRRIAVSQCDLKSATAVENLILGINPSLIYHLSSNNDNGRDGVDGISVLEDVALSTFNILRAASFANRRPRVIFPSSAEVTKYNASAAEHTPYSAGKFICELMGSSLRQAGQAEFVSIRLPTIFGVGDTKASRLIPSVLGSLVQGRKFSASDPKAMVKMIHSTKAAELLYKISIDDLSESESEELISACPSMSVQELVSLVAKVYSQVLSHTDTSALMNDRLSDEALWTSERGVRLLEYYGKDLRLTINGYLRDAHENDTSDRFL